MKPLNEFFNDYLLGGTSKSLFHRVYVAETKYKYDCTKLLERFLESRLDINRLKAANQFIDESIFKVNVWPELGELRKAVAEREVRREMRYEKYRDHTCHTLWGFLLGCLLFEHSPRLRKLIAPFRDHSTLEKDYETMERFGGMWLLGFLCHDIGYLFESDIPGGLVANPLHDLQAACALLNDFFHNDYISRYIGESTTDNFDELRKINYPNFPNNSLSIVAQALRKLPMAGIVVTDIAGQGMKIPADVFDLFRKHKCKGVETVETAYRFLYETGKYGQKFLDHGVVSGLLMAQLLVLGYGLYFTSRFPKGNEGDGRHSEDFLQRVKQKTTYSTPLTIEMMMRRLSWIFAAAQHNLEPDWWKTEPKISAPKPRRLKAEDDPPSFLVMLVDTLQDWDRPRMNAKTRSDDFVMDSADMQMGIVKERLRIQVRNGAPQARLGQLKKDLDSRLIGWEAFVELVNPVLAKK